MKGNVLGVLTWWRTPRSVSLSPGLSCRPCKAHLSASELTSLDASWITTTLWAVSDMLPPGEGALGVYVSCFDVFVQLKETGVKYKEEEVWVKDSDRSMKVYRNWVFVLFVWKIAKCFLGFFFCWCWSGGVEVLLYSRAFKACDQMCFSCGLDKDAASGVHLIITIMRILRILTHWLF